MNYNNIIHIVYIIRRIIMAANNSLESIKEAITTIITEKCVTKAESEFRKRQSEKIEKQIENLEILLALTRDTQTQVVIPVRKQKAIIEHQPEAPKPSTAPVETPTKTNITGLGTRDKFMKRIVVDNKLEFRKLIPTEIFDEVQSGATAEMAEAFTKAQWELVSTKLWPKIRDAKQSKDGKDNIYVDLNRKLQVLFDKRGELDLS